jgi:hypothetical protein
MRACVFLVERSAAAQPSYRFGATGLLAVIGCAFFLAGAPASYALDSSNANNAPQKISPEAFTSAEEALRAGVNDLHHGDAQESLRALTYAAEGGQLLARWKLGNLYSTGDLVPRNDMLAYKYFEQLVESYSEDEVDRRDLGAISNAFVAVGLYSLSGIPDSDIKPDPERALEMFQVAATDFGDPEAQYQLGRMYLEGAAGLIKDNIRAARWLALAAEKGHCGAQALLGHLLFNGEGVPRQRARGLMWLSVAANGAKGAKDAWIRELQTKDFNAASEDDREVATTYLNARGKEGEALRLNALHVTKPPMRLPGAAPMVVSAPANNE